MANHESTSAAPTHETAPPTHNGLPVIGNTHQLVSEQGGIYEAAAEQGDVVHLYILGIGDLYQVNHPALAQRILVEDHDRFAKASMSQEDLGDLLGRGLVLSEGDLWERQRERIQPAFYMDRIADYADTITAQVFTRSGSRSMLIRSCVILYRYAGTIFGVEPVRLS